MSCGGLGVGYPVEGWQWGALWRVGSGVSCEGLAVGCSAEG